MGYSYSGDDDPVMCFNGAKSFQTGWYTSKSKVVTAGECFEENVYGVADYGNPDSSIVLVKIIDSSSTDIYVTYNRQIGINVGTQEAIDQVTVTRADGDGVGPASSELLAKLNTGGSWSVPVDGKTTTISVLGIDAKFARVVFPRKEVHACSSIMLRPPEIQVPALVFRLPSLWHRQLPDLPHRQLPVQRVHRHQPQQSSPPQLNQQAESGPRSQRHGGRLKSRR